MIAKVRVCKDCDTEKAFVFKKEVPLDHGTIRKVYVNELGKAWNGKRCPDCHHSDLLERSRKKQIKKNKENGKI